MKNKVLIIEDNSYRYFTTKAVLSAKLKLDIKELVFSDPKDLIEATTSMSARVIFRPAGGIVELLSYLKRQKINRRNTELVLISICDMEASIVPHLESFVKEKRGVAKAA